MVLSIALVGAALGDERYHSAICTYGNDGADRQRKGRRRRCLWHWCEPGKGGGVLVPEEDGEQELIGLM
ncbi:MAG: hypothetical protein IJO13_02495 [Lachnospiraceae bacterium]|nr:hypothetical protein [Lachnospiraceae bacterium]